ncbi:hypothetical protein QQ045_008654 [Rhodiola kirilowii]
MNKYNLVFVPFTGVDNQLRSVTLAAGLISMEDVDSYTWLLTCFKTLLEREPSVIVTDQDASMKAAIATIFPSSRHRFRMWHITEKLQAKVGISKCRETSFLNSIKAVIWGEYNDCKEFEVTWCELITKYDLHGNKWLADMYNIRSSWIPVYFRDVNMGALLRTTTRSESENSFFGRWHIDASRRHNPGLFLVDPENPNQLREQIMLSSEVWFHVNADMCSSFMNDVDSIRKFHDHIYEFVKEHASNGGVDCSSSKDGYF